MGEVKKQAERTYHIFICLPVFYHVCTACTNDYKFASTHDIAGHTVLQNLPLYRAYITAFQIGWILQHIFLSFLPFKLQMFLLENWHVFYQKHLFSKICLYIRKLHFFWKPK